MHLQQPGLRVRVGHRPGQQRQAPWHALAPPDQAQQPGELLPGRTHRHRCHTSQEPEIVPTGGGGNLMRVRGAAEEPQQRHVEDLAADLDLGPEHPPGAKPPGTSAGRARRADPSPGP